MIIKDDVTYDQEQFLLYGLGTSTDNKKYWFKLLVQALLIMPYPSNENFFKVHGGYVDP